MQRRWMDAPGPPPGAGAAAAAGGGSGPLWAPFARCAQVARALAVLPLVLGRPPSAAGSLAGASGAAAGGVAAGGVCVDLAAGLRSRLFLRRHASPGVYVPDAAVRRGGRSRGRHPGRWSSGRGSSSSGRRWRSGSSGSRRRRAKRRPASAAQPTLNALDQAALMGLPGGLGGWNGWGAQAGAGAATGGTPAAGDLLCRSLTAKNPVVLGPAEPFFPPLRVDEIIYHRLRARTPAVDADYMTEAEMWAPAREGVAPWVRGPSSQAAHGRERAYFDLDYTGLSAKSTHPLTEEAFNKEAALFASNPGEFVAILREIMARIFPAWPLSDAERRVIAAQLDGHQRCCIRAMYEGKRQKLLAGTHRRLAEIAGPWYATMIDYVRTGGLDAMVAGAGGAGGGLARAPNAETAREDGDKFFALHTLLGLQAPSIEAVDARTVDVAAALAAKSSDAFIRLLAREREPSSGGHGPSVGLRGLIRALTPSCVPESVLRDNDLQASLVRKYKVASGDDLYYEPQLPLGAPRLFAPFDRVTSRPLPLRMLEAVRSQVRVRDLTRPGALSAGPGMLVASECLAGCGARKAVAPAAFGSVVPVEQYLETLEGLRCDSAAGSCRLAGGGVNSGGSANSAGGASGTAAGGIAVTRATVTNPLGTGGITPPLTTQTIAYRSKHPGVVTPHVTGVFAKSQKPELLFFHREPRDFATTRDVQFAISAHFMGTEVVLTAVVTADGRVLALRRTPGGDGAVAWFYGGPDAGFTLLGWAAAAQKLRELTPFIATAVYERTRVLVDTGGKQEFWHPNKLHAERWYALGADELPAIRLRAGWTQGKD